MKENKNIERLFQEKFKDFEVSPPEIVWDNIQEKLNPKEKKRRVIPFWFKTAGIAASFIAIVSVIFYSTNNDFNKVNSINNNSVVNSNNEKNNSNQNKENEQFNSSDSNKNLNNSNSSFKNDVKNNSESNSLVTNNTTSSDSDSGANLKSNRSSLGNSSSTKSNRSYVLNPKKRFYQDAINKNKKFNSDSNSEVVANRNNKNKFRNKNTKFNSKFYDLNATQNPSLNSGITDINSNTDFKPFNNKNSKFRASDINSTTDFNTTNNKNLNSRITDKNSLADFNTTTNKNSDLLDIDINKLNSSTISSNNNNAIVENQKENSTENLNNTTTAAIVAIEETRVDTITLATLTIEENPLEKLLREKETKKVVDEKEKWSKWAVNSYVSPIFFNSFASGSPLSDEFESNEKTFKNSTSYGVGVAYNLNKRLSIKTGVSNLNLEYDTESIAFYSTYEDQSKISNTNIERNANGKYLALKHTKDDSKNAFETQMMKSNQNLGTLNQKTQYIEVPLEMSYAILNKRFGVAIKGGMSTLFLTENVVSIMASDGNMQIGKASNLNNVHFSSNLGLGFSYSFLKNLQLNVEPTLKYQLNTFNKNSDDFTPYVIGVNTGISYKF